MKRGCCLVIAGQVECQCLALPVEKHIWLTNHILQGYKGVDDLMFCCMLAKKRVAGTYADAAHVDADTLLPCTSHTVTCLQVKCLFGILALTSDLLPIRSFFC